mmetsp:Transcript_43803/g.123999  ORF Transcript_43803/g.123999 Transcript_43803/m.123999 type:complete len:203 (+) Transcript_43803:759-1367(+)
MLPRLPGVLPLRHVRPLRQRPGRDGHPGVLLLPRRRADARHGAGADGGEHRGGPAGEVGVQEPALHNPREDILHAVPVPEDRVAVRQPAHRGQECGAVGIPAPAPGLLLRGPALVRGAPHGAAERAPQARRGRYAGRVQRLAVQGRLPRGPRDRGPRRVPVAHLRDRARGQPRLVLTQGARSGGCCALAPVLQGDPTHEQPS